MGKKIPFISLIIILGLFLEYIIIEIASLLPFIGNLKKEGNLNFPLVKEETLNILKNPFSTISDLIASNNPLFYIGSIAVVIYILVVMFKNPFKHKEWEAETHNTTHGGARYARPSEVFIPNQIKGCSSRQLLEQFKTSLRRNGDDQ